MSVIGFLNILLGYTTPKQISGGPEMLGFNDAAANRVCIGQWKGSETGARYLRDIQGNQEWKGPDPDPDQNTLFGHSALGRMSLQGVGGGGLSIVAWKFSLANNGGTITDSQTSLVVLSGAVFGSGAVNLRGRIENEIIHITNVSTNTLTITRGYEGTTAATHPDGSVVCWLGNPEDQPRIAFNNDGGGIIFTNGTTPNGAALQLADTGFLNFLMPSSLSSFGVGLLKSGDSYQRVYLAEDGVRIGSGAAALDVAIQRTGAKTLAIKPIGGDVAGMFRVLTSADADVLVVDTDTPKVTVSGCDLLVDGVATVGSLDVGAYANIIDSARVANFTQLKIGGTTVFGTDALLPVAQGGTAAATAATARSNLGVPGIPVGTTEGGTGATVVATARANLSAAVASGACSFTLTADLVTGAVTGTITGPGTS